jgi:type IV pilus assembly protein PilX
MMKTNVGDYSHLNKLSSIKAERWICRERGVSLVVALIFLIILTILGLTAMRVATMEERMSGNSRDRSLAFQAAEAALRDAESDIECKKFGTPPNPRSVCISGMTGADAACTNGLCCNLSGLTCIEPAVPVYSNKSLTAAPSIKYGDATGASTLTGLSLQPRYLIEPFMVDGKNYYRITVRGYGVNSDTQVTLQEVYYKE